jgi:hypothetical protein
MRRLEIATLVAFHGRRIVDGENRFASGTTAAIRSKRNHEPGDRAMKTISLENLAIVVGGADKADMNTNLNRREGCKQWAESQPTGASAKSALCEKEFVRQNWENFAPTPGVVRRQPL